MAKRKVTVTVDEDLVEAARTLGAESLSGVVNAALIAEIDRRARAAALMRRLEDWDRELGPVGEEAAHAATAAFDDLDAVAAGSPEPASAVPADASPGGTRMAGAAGAARRWCSTRRGCPPCPRPGLRSCSGPCSPRPTAVAAR